MNYRNEPTLKEVRTEAERLVPLLPQMIPIEWRIRKVEIVRRIVDKDTAKTFSLVDFFEDVDGGKSIDIKVSTVDFDRNGNWKVSLLSRLLHEMFHAKIFSAEANLLRDLIVEGYLHDGEYNSFIEGLIEDSANALEGVVHFFATRYEV